MKSCCSTPHSCCEETIPAQKAALSIALVGNPNCGKTTLFNALTGARQRVGKWPGVTVERKSGYFTEKSMTVEVVDLPGVYSLTLACETAAIDERIACDFILCHQSDIIINIVDASNLERHLYLTTQLVEMGAPVILALNMMDVARTRQIQIDKVKLSQELGCPVIALEASKGSGVAELKQAIVRYRVTESGAKQLSYPAAIQEAIAAIRSLHVNPWQVVRVLEDDVYVRGQVAADVLEKVQAEQHRIQQIEEEDADILIAETRYQFIQHILQQCLTRGKEIKTTWTSYIDNIVLNRILGIPIFLAMMYLLFLFSLNIGGAFQDFFDIGSQTIFVDGFAYWLTSHGAPTWLTVLLANGVGKGINTTVTFIPVIGSLFLFLSLLEDSGYMARAAFVIDRFMRALGLPGKAFVPMIVGFGCNVPAVMAARTLENKRDRILTIMMAPFMSCGARLAIYAVFTAAFFPHGGQNIVFALYLTGIAMAIFTGLLLRKTLLKGDPAPLILELPPYHVPRVKTLCLLAWQRLKSFVFRAGKLIVPICVLIGALNALNIDGTMNSGDGSTQSLLSAMGQWLTPIFAPMGIHQNNWPATVGLVTGVLAKEVVVGTLNTLYTELGHFAAAPDAAFHFWAGLQNAIASIPANFSQFGSSLANPVLAKAPVHTVTEGVYGLMAERFDGRAGAMAYLLFVLLYFPCISTTAAMLRELNRSWTGFSVVWTTVVAYGAAVIFYQFATFFAHPVSSLAWILGIVSVFFSIVILMRFMSSEKGGRYEFARN